MLGDFEELVKETRAYMTTLPEDSRDARAIKNALQFESRAFYERFSALDDIQDTIKDAIFEHDKGPQAKALVERLRKMGRWTVMDDEDFFGT